MIKALAITLSIGAAGSLGWFAGDIVDHVGDRVLAELQAVVSAFSSDPRQQSLECIARVEMPRGMSECGEYVRRWTARDGKPAVLKEILPVLADRAVQELDPFSQVIFQGFAEKLRSSR